MPDDYRQLLENHQQWQGVDSGPVQVDLGDRVRSYLDRDLDQHARPFTIVCSPAVSAISADHLEPTLRTAAAARAPVRLLTL